MKRILRWAALAALVLVAVAGVGVGWYYAGEILIPAPAEPEVGPPADPALRPVAVDGPLGSYPGWVVPAAGGPHDDVWAVFVHGRGADADRCAGLLPTLRQLRIDLLCASYRNDDGAPPDPRGLYRQGDEEWKDVAAAVDLARDRGARRIVLVGESMGGQITAHLLRNLGSPDVVAVVWDSPLLDWGPAIARGAEDRDVPAWLVPLGMTFSEIRADVDYQDLNHIVHAEEFSLPILLLHGTGDRTVPVSVSDRFADAAPDRVTYVRVEGVAHLGLRASDPQRYQKTVTRFLTEVLSSSGAALGGG